MQTFSMPVSWQLAPNALNQPILPDWQFHLFNVNLGSSSNPSVEQTVLRDVGSYGRQIGRLAEALEVVVRKSGLLDGDQLTREERDTLLVFLGDVAKVRQIKTTASPS